MSKKVKVRKKSGKNRIALDPLGSIKLRQTLKNETALDNMELRLRIIYELLRTRSDDFNVDAWQDFADALNTSVLLCRTGVSKELYHIIEKSLFAMMNLKERFKKTRQFGCSGDDLNAIRKALNVHIMQCRTASLKQMQIALTGAASVRAGVA